MKFIILSGIGMLMIFLLICSILAYSENTFSTEILGKTCKSNKDCFKTEFCKFKTGLCKGNGICAKKPRVCIMVWNSVCGCDGRIYSNECVANANGVNVICKGECRPQCKWY